MLRSLFTLILVVLALPGSSAAGDWTEFEAPPVDTESVSCGRVNGGGWPSPRPSSWRARGIG